MLFAGLGLIDLKCIDFVLQTTCVTDPVLRDEHVHLKVSYVDIDLERQI